MRRPPSSGLRWLERIEESRVIAALRSLDDVQSARASGLGVAFVLNCTIFELRAIASQCRQADVICFAHLDLVEGVGKDASGIRLLAEAAGVDGIITTRTALVREAHRCGLVAIQRVFLLDSASLTTAISAVQSAKPDAVEVMPALVFPAVAPRLPFADLPPVIAGGLVQTPEEMQQVLRAPVIAVSTSARALWKRWGTSRQSPPVA